MKRDYGVQEVLNFSKISDLRSKVFYPAIDFELEKLGSKSSKSHLKYNFTENFINKLNSNSLECDTVLKLTTQLPAPYASIQQGFDAILKTFENVSYIGELRQRWLEIKKLLKGGLQDAIPAAMQAK